MNNFRVSWSQNLKNPLGGIVEKNKWLILEERLQFLLVVHYNYWCRAYFVSLKRYCAI